MDNLGAILIRKGKTTSPQHTHPQYTHINIHIYVYILARQQSSSHTTQKQPSFHQSNQIEACTILYKSARPIMHTRDTYAHSHIRTHNHARTQTLSSVEVVTSHCIVPDDQLGHTHNIASSEVYPPVFRTYTLFVCALMTHTAHKKACELVDFGSSVHKNPW